MSRYFVFVPPETITDGGGVFEIYLDDTFYLVVLTSSVHVNWALATGTRHRSGRRYIAECFTMFPFPDCGEAEKNTVREAMENILDHRKKYITGETGATMAAAQRLLADMQAGEKLNDRDADAAEKLHITELMALHKALDKTVIEAYGWKPAMRPNDRLEALYRLNKERRGASRQSALVETGQAKNGWLRITITELMTNCLRSTVRAQFIIALPRCWHKPSRLKCVGWEPLNAV